MVRNSGDEVTLIRKGEKNLALLENIKMGNKKMLGARFPRVFFNVKE